MFKNCLTGGFNSISDDPWDVDLPPFMQKATQRLTRGLNPNEYDKHNFKDMIKRCTHLDEEKKKVLRELFSDFSELFSGALGKIPGVKIKLKLKKDIAPFHSRPYSVPKAFEVLAKKEVQDLVDIGVLIKNVRTTYTSPSFFRRKKDGGIRFVSDLRKLNSTLQRQPFPLPIVDNVIWKISGFTYATCFDLNRGYYHFEIHEESRDLTGIVLPWGTYCYARLPQGLMISSDVFQEKMTRIFSDFDDIIVYVDNIILYTKSDFNDHVRRISAVLQQLQAHNLHVHIEKTYLASQKVDYLGYTLTTEGIQPQVTKVLPILKFSPPKNRRQLQGFLGLIDYYKN